MCPFIENQYIILGTLRVANRSPTATSKTNISLRPFGDIWGVRGHRFRSILGLPGGPGRENKNIFLMDSTGYLKAVWPDLFGCVFEVCPAPGPRERPAPTFLKAFPGPRGRPDLKNAPKKVRPDCLQVP